MHLLYNVNNKFSKIKLYLYFKTKLEILFNIKYVAFSLFWNVFLEKTQLNKKHIVLNNRISCKAIKYTNYLHNRNIYILYLWLTKNAIVILDDCCLDENHLSLFLTIRIVEINYRKINWNHILNNACVFSISDSF